MKIQVADLAVMFAKGAVVLALFVAVNGYVIGSVSPGKKSDFSMYDNQFCK